MLRAHMAQKFKTPGAHQSLIAGDNNQVLVIGAAERDELVRLRQEAKWRRSGTGTLRQMAQS
jgi:hypothetical protein